MEKFRYIAKTKLSTLPKAPGVYALLSPKAILYIGKAVNIQDRVKNHFTPSLRPVLRSTATEGDQGYGGHANFKDSLFIDKVTKIGYIKTDSDIDALLLESRLIKAKQPKYNVMWKDDKKYFYVAITKEKLPRIFLTHQPFVASAPQVIPTLRAVRLERGLRPLYKKGEGTERSEVRMQYIGPFVEGKAIKQVLRLLRRIFPYYTSKKHGPLPCQYCHLNLCPGPTPDKVAYKKNIHNLIAVLKGKRTSVLKQLEKEMNKAAKSQDFERASVLRDQFLSLERIVSHAQHLSPVVSESLHWNAIEKELQKLFLTKKRITRIEAYDISNIQGKEATGSQVTFFKGVPLKESYRKYKIRLVYDKTQDIAKHSAGTPRYNARRSQAVGSDPNDFAMMTELLERRLLHPGWPYPQIMVIDGGKGQLTAALKAISNLISLSYPQLTESKLQGIKIVALAKKHNELFFPKKPKPVLLRDLPRPLENLFLHIRDEAHRFAISYHRFLHRKETLGRNT